MLVFGLGIWDRGGMNTLARGLFWSCHKRHPPSPAAEPMSGLSIALGFVCIKCLRHSAPAEDAASWKGQLTHPHLCFGPLAPTHSCVGAA